MSKTFKNSIYCKIQPFKKEFACMYITQKKDWKDMHQYGCDCVCGCVCVCGCYFGVVGLEVRFIFFSLTYMFTRRKS